MARQLATLKALRGGVRMRTIRDFDTLSVVLIATTLGLISLGILMVTSASVVASYTENQGPLGHGMRHIMYAVIGCIGLAVMTKLRTNHFWRFALPAYLAALGLQLLVFTPLGVEVWGNRNWVRLGSVQLQPSEFLKLTSIIALGLVITNLARGRRKLGQQLLVIALIVCPALGLIMLGRDLGTAMVLVLALFGAMLFADVSPKVLISAAGGAFLGVLIFVLQSPNRLNRISALWGAADSSVTDLDSTNWQPLHGMWAISSGGIFGTGLGNSKAKWSWLPAAEDDYIFAIIGEEIGLLGCLFVIISYIVLTWAMLSVIARSHTLFQKAIVGGVLIWIIGQAFINIAVVLRILPVLGVPLPFLSSGGSALIASSAAIGVVIAIARETAPQKQQHPTLKEQL